MNNNFEKMVECPDCEGTGVYVSSHEGEWECQFCGGVGEVLQEDARENIENWEEYTNNKETIMNIISKFK